VNFLSAPKLMMLLKQISLWKSSLFLDFFHYFQTSKPTAVIRCDLKGYNRLFEGDEDTIFLGTAENFCSLLMNCRALFIHTAAFALFGMRWVLFFCRIAGQSGLTLTWLFLPFLRAFGGQIG
jgi:hypothetical protein